MELTPEEEAQFIEQLQKLIEVNAASIAIERVYKVYYDESGNIITYTTEDIPGQYIVITQDDYNIARHDAKVINEKLIYTHNSCNTLKLLRNDTEGVRTSKYDVSILVDDDSVESTYYTISAHAIL